MTPARLRALRLRHHRLSAPARTLSHAAAHMTATQGQEFWGGRLALAARTARAPTMADVDASFDRGELVRSWTMRGTLHIAAPRISPGSSASRVSGCCAPRANGTPTSGSTPR